MDTANNPCYLLVQNRILAKFLLTCSVLLHENRLLFCVSCNWTTILSNIIYHILSNLNYNHSEVFKFCMCFLSGTFSWCILFILPPLTFSTLNIISKMFLLFSKFFCLFYIHQCYDYDHPIITDNCFKKVFLTRIPILPTENMESNIYETGQLIIPA